ncbi:MAG: putative DNA binding domain-containing protein [Bifidobacteriaceae bacterium]|jgi:ATP-dependent DNA helicase RecG|nr:putative DNA binding domain-containing protein [Bifidobacteriaceae bacterium]
MNLASVVSMMRSEGSDTTRYEAKRALGGFPDNIAETLSAFANTPGGGVIIFGLDEETGFAATGVYDLAKCQQAVTSLARTALDPPIQVTTHVEEFEGASLVLVDVPEADKSLKPVRVKRIGRGYLRQYDGDYPLSDLEEQAFLTQRGQPRFDHEAVTEATLGDLDGAAVAAYLAERRLQSPRLAALPDPELLTRTGVVADGVPTLAGLLTFGIYPQQFFPNLGIQASLHQAGTGPAVRALESVYFGGSIPAMLEDATAWVARVAGRPIMADAASGRVVDRPTYPPVAVRELVANALVHRDLGPYALNTPIRLIVDEQQLSITNEGGLFGLTVATLGKGPSRLRNARLTEILQAVRTRDGARVIERLGSGIPATRQALHEAGLAPPVFIDQGVRFIAKLTAAPVKAALTPKSNAHLIAAALARQPAQSVTELVGSTGLTRRQVEYTLKVLTQTGTVMRGPGHGRAFTYRLPT